jgi:hypothetical protein
MTFDNIFIYEQERHRKDFWINLLRKKYYFYLSVNDDGSLNCKKNFVISPNDLYDFEEGEAFGIDHLPFKFKVAYGLFEINGLKLKTFEGSPEICHGSFNASFNEPITLEGGPRIVKGRYNIEYSKNLNNLIGSPEECGVLYCSSSGLKTLKGCTENLDGLICRKNELKDLIGAPSKIRYLDCSENHLKTLEGCPMFANSGNNVVAKHYPSMHESSISKGKTIFSLNSMFDSNNDSLKSVNGIKNMPDELWATTSIKHMIENKIHEIKAEEKYNKKDLDDYFGVDINNF